MIAKEKVLKVHPQDNIIVALEDFPAGHQLQFQGQDITLLESIPIKHKFSARDFLPGDQIIMYGVLVGLATKAIPKGCRISTENIRHAAGDYSLQSRSLQWSAPDHSRFAGRSFMGYHRPDGKVGIRNYWLVIPLVFCENRNIKVIQEAMTEQLGFATEKEFLVDTQQLIELYKKGSSEAEILSADIVLDAQKIRNNKLFPNVDGIKFLLHDGGCGCTRQDSAALCHLLAGYITHPNVAGATVLSLGCQIAQFEDLKSAIRNKDADFQKPLFFLEQQKSHSERELISDAVKKTFIGLMRANQVERQPAELSKLCVGLECGGSDGFSGISANPALGHMSDLLVALGGSTILSEFPELNGVEQELINRCVNDELAKKFHSIMKAYSNRAEAAGSGFEMNPSPGNIKDGLITDAIKSAGAAKKGGTSPVRDVLDYAESVTQAGLNLLCTPGNDVESTTGLAGAGANIIVFTTGLGTPTGNAVAPTIKVSTNNRLAQHMPDIIDINAGTIITGEDSIQSKGEELLEYIIQVANGDYIPHAERLGQDDFIPWKRGISL